VFKPLGSTSSIDCCGRRVVVIILLTLIYLISPLHPDGTPSKGPKGGLLSATVGVEEALEDTRYLFQRLKKIHPNIFFNLTREEAEEEFNRLREKISSRKRWSKRELFRSLAPFVAGFRDAHTGLVLYPQYREFVAKGGEVIPLLVEFTGEEILIVSRLDGAKIPAGARLLSIDGISARKIRKEIIETTSYERIEYALAWAGRLFPLHLWGLFNVKAPYRVEYLLPEGEEVRTTQLKGISAEEYNRGKEEVLSLIGEAWALSFPREGVGLLTVNTFSGEKGREFEEFLRDSFQEIERKGAQALIIDLRRNTGGSTDLSERLYSYVSDRPYRNFAQVKVNYSDPVLKKRKVFNPITLFKVKVLGKSVVTFNNELNPPGKNPLRFSGKLYLLIGPMTFSTGVDFAALIKDIGPGLVVGAETGGLPSCYGDTFWSNLPNSGLSLKTSYKHFLRPGGFDDGRGVRPDIPVDWSQLDLLNGEDPALEKVLEEIAEGKERDE